MNEDALKEYRYRFQNIVEKFRYHKIEINKTPINILEDDISRIKYLINKLKLDYEWMKRLIKDIEKSINFEKSQKNNAKKGLFASSALGIFSTLGGLATFNVASFVYGVYSISSALCGFIQTKNIVIINNRIKELYNILEEAINESKKIENDLDNISKLFKEKIKERSEFKFII